MGRKRILYPSSYFARFTRNIREVHFTNTDLSETNFQDTDLLGTIFHKCNLTKSDFRNAENYTIDLQTNTLKKARFSFPEAISLLKSLDIEIL